MKLENIYLRDADHIDLNTMAQIHLLAFPGFFLSRMGLPFLRLYYSAVINFESNISLLACDSETRQPLGFAVGFLDPQGFYHSFRRQALRLILPALSALFRDPGLVMQLLRNIGRVDKRASQQREVGVAELSSIAVATQNRGIGGMLLRAFVNRADALGATSITLLTDAHNNDPVRHFYERHEFEVVGFELRGSRRLCRYIKHIG